MMKYTLLLMIFVFASCSESCPDCKAEADAKEAEALTNVRALANQGWNDRDITGFLANLSDDFVRTENGKTVVNNKGEMEPVMNMFFTAFPDMKLTISNTTIGSSTTVNEWSATGTHNGTFGDIPATGKTVTFAGSSTITYNDEGLISREDVYFDMLSLMTQLGYSLAAQAEETSAM